MRAAIVVLALLALPGCCADRGAHRVRDDRWADRAMPGSYGPIVYERVVDEGVDGNGDPYRFEAGGYGWTRAEAYSRANGRTGGP